MNAREEQDWGDAVRLFNFIASEKGRSAALDYFKDGAGYFVSARTQVPFVPPHRAFILFLCWDLANFRGNGVILQKLGKLEAVVRMKLLSFLLYEAAAHLKQQISFENYRAIFETIWLDRALKAGWNLDIRYEEEEVVFIFTRTVPGMSAASEEFLLTAGIPVGETKILDGLEIQLKTHLQAQKDVQASRNGLTEKI